MRRLLGGYAALVLAALYAPLLILAVFSVNEGKFFHWDGFTLRWYRSLALDHQIRASLGNALRIALASAGLATVLGTLAALAARRAFGGIRIYAALVLLPVIVPDIVLAIGARMLFDALGVPLSLWTATAAHTTFNLSYVAVIVAARQAGLDPRLEEAARDLGATAAGAFFRVTLPALRPAVIAGALVAFTLSFDDFVVTYFTTGPGSATLPVQIYSMARSGVRQEVKALSTVLLVVSFALLGAAVRIAAPRNPGGEKR